MKTLAKGGGEAGITQLMSKQSFSKVGVDRELGTEKRQNQVKITIATTIIIIQKSCHKIDTTQHVASA